MKGLSHETQLELEYRLGSNEGMINILVPEDAIAERKAWSYGALAGSYFGRGVLLQLLGQNAKAEEAFSQVIANSKNSVGANLFEQDHSHQYALFIFALLVGDYEQANESAYVISKLGVTSSRLQAPSEVYVAFVELWLKNADSVKALIPSLEKIENKKNEKYIKSGFVNALKGVLDGNLSLVVDGIQNMLAAHKHEAKYLKEALDHNHFICIPALLLSIVAIRYGMDIKKAVEGSEVVLKTKMESPLDRPEIPEKTKFEVPVDLIPDYIIEKWY
ncbi:hypothetical protein [Pseudoalteromonas luteoviolacea]|uniref:Uncharacterized protein n=1 Tax=Pseudoalteromonas luteoviolacea S4054 TaxID=1129367 RepID=A0A0F6A4Y3_9GAMM|nr:hypothetical protein [Pseudoalteromonas luteoviolacea]AOT07559.1 hypothetical protein S4054249_06760 [Pseudoalteromonas luteoviolacea]AOT12475.1 hypothetical protein S40542_06760 [Pseudoalteromonas luteoviolacea]AOT17389.1 hypothetical protein S4054_06760 [Pseudoalteromonas luteoviolacea]KKE81232.1 hypothetical protein N479_23230 [Pseudoalteromonas luteoviolacea S4054]KZN78536.1 hypothetical protein N481_26025 [Pseudoalteromonas luteoviolacea S4047-1]